MGFEDLGFATRFPALYEWLTLTMCDGQPRETATLLLFVEEGRIKGCLHSREDSQVLFRSSSTLEGLLGSFEGVLADGSAEWREKKGKR